MTEQLDRGVHGPLACASYWFPLLTASGVPVPETLIVKAPDLTPLLDGEPIEGWDEFLAGMITAGDAMGYPCFIRTGRFSGKHSWRRTCYVPDAAMMARHIGAIVEESHLADFMGLDTSVWLVRRFLWPHQGYWTAFDGLPMRRERRSFIGRGDPIIMPYWPADAIRKPSSPSWEKALERLNTNRPEDYPEIRKQALRVAEEFRGLGAWSLDWMWHQHQWVAIDMAPAECSWGNPWAEEAQR